MRLLTLRALDARRQEGDNGLFDATDRCFLDQISCMYNSIQLTETEGTRPRRLLKGRDTSVNNFQQLSQNLGILVEQIFRELIVYSRKSLNDADYLTEDEERLEKMLVQ